MPNLFVKSLSTRFGFASIMVPLWLMAFATSFHGAFSTIRASHAILNNEALWIAPLAAEDAIMRRSQIQAHYLSYGVYIPLDDIVIGAHVSNTQPLPKSIKGVCGPGVTSIWVPVVFYFPIFGEKVFEWCLVKT